VAAGQINAIRVQDIATGKWFNWDNRGWDTVPIVTPGAGKLYIAFWATNYSDAGYLTLSVIDDTGAVLATKTVWAEPWYGDINKGVGIEAPNLTMPGRNYGITLKVTP